MLKKFFRFLSSMDLAIILISAIAGLAVSSSFFDKPEVFHSTPFRILVLCFFVNLLFCTIKILPGVYRVFTKNVKTLPERQGTLLPIEGSAGAMKEYLAKEKYAVETYEDASGEYLLARKKRVALLAPHLLHVGLLVIIIGAFLTTFQVTDTMKITEGQMLDLPEAIAAKVGSGTLTLREFETTRDSEGNITNWISVFDLALEGKPAISSAVTKVNHPFKKNGLTIYQMAYSDEHLVHLSGTGKTDGDYVLPEEQAIPIDNEKGAASIKILPMTEDVGLIYTYDGNGKQLTENAFRPGDEIHLPNGALLKYEKPIAFTVLQIKYNPFLPIVFLGFIIATLASMLFWVGRYREIGLFIPKEVSVRGYVLCKDKQAIEKIRKDLAGGDY